MGSFPLFIFAAALCAQFLLALSACDKVAADDAATAPSAVAPVAAVETTEKTSAELSGWVFDTAFALEEVPEPSGLCFHPLRDSLFVVDDGGTDRPAALYEIDLEANVLNKAQFGRDLEGVCYCPVDGLLYVADEADETIYAIEPEIMRLYGIAEVSRSFEGSELLKAGGNGFEGIAFIPAVDANGVSFAEDGNRGSFALLNQDDPHCVVLVSYNEMESAMEQSRQASIEARFLLPQVNAGELHYNHGNGELWVINSWMNVMQVYRARTMELLRWEVVPGAAQEGITIDSMGHLWIGQDLGGIARYVWKGEK